MPSKASKSQAGSTPTQVANKIIPARPIMSAYAIYRLPDTDNAIKVDGEITKINNLQNISEQQGFLVAPFDTSHHHILLITPDNVTHLPLQDTPSGNYRDFNTITETPYIQAFHKFHNAVANGPFHKLVLSRAITVGSIGIQQPESLFMKACARYPHQMVTLFSTEESGTWLIITPEILLTSSNNGTCRTMALAGTMPADTDDKWSEKNRQEQRIVSDYINLTIAPLASDIRLTEPYSVKAGGVQHLRTDFEFVGKKGFGIGKILDALHPTPAVCGLPKKEAMQFILDNEGYDREYYSGFSGPLNIQGSSNLYVTLRCAKLTGQYATLYAGGGIMPESELLSEDFETQLKMGTIKYIL